MHAERTRGGEAIQLWWVDLDDAGWDNFFTVLSPDEISKAERFLTISLQQRYRRCRCALRLTLANFSKVKACNIQFQYGRFGKPELKDRSIYFNLSHSGDKALIGISAAPLGVDIEYFGNTASNIDQLIELVCHDTERKYLNDLPEVERIRLFYRLWTQKEAYCKMLGIGLASDLKLLQFEPLDDGACVRVRDELRKDDPAYFVRTSVHKPGYVTSVCSSNLASITTEQPKLQRPCSLNARADGSIVFGQYCL